MMRRRHYDPLTYRYPRNMDEAFAPTPQEYACAITKHTNVGLKFATWFIRGTVVVSIIFLVASTLKGI